MIMCLVTYLCFPSLDSTKHLFEAVDPWSREGEEGSAPSDSTSLVVVTTLRDCCAAAVTVSADRLPLSGPVMTDAGTAERTSVVAGRSSSPATVASLSSESPSTSIASSTLAVVWGCECVCILIFNVFETDVSSLKVKVQRWVCPGAYGCWVSTSITNWPWTSLGVPAMGTFLARFRRQPASSDDAPRGPSRVTDQDKAVFVSELEKLINYVQKY